MLSNNNNDYTNTEKSWLLLDNIDIEGTRLFPFSRPPFFM
jgi:hypothetical protein